MQLLVYMAEFENTGPLVVCPDADRVTVRPAVGGGGVKLEAPGAWWPGMEFMDGQDGVLLSRGEAFTVVPW